MEIVSGLNQLVSVFVLWMIRVVMVLMVIFGLLMVRQASQMDKVLSVSVGGWFKFLVFAYLLLTVLLALAVVLA